MNAINITNKTAGYVRQLDSGKWQATVILGEGRGAPRKTKTFTGRRAAVVWMNKARESGLPAGAAAEQTVAQAFDHYVSAKVMKPNTANSFQAAKAKTIASKLGAVKLKTLKPSAVVAFTTWMVADGLAPSTVNIYAKKLNTVLKFAAADGALSFVPKASTVTEHPVEVEVITAADVRKLYEAAGEEFAPVILFGAFAGLRASEACAVTVADIDFAGGMVSVNKAIDVSANFVTTKTARSIRQVPLPLEVLALLGQASKGKPLGDTVATTTTGAVISTPTFAKTFAKIAIAAEVPVTFHSLRKFFATTQLSNGVNPKAVAKALGDSVETMLKTYALVAATDNELIRAATARAFAATIAA